MDKIRGKAAVMSASRTIRMAKHLWPTIRRCWKLRPCGLNGGYRIATTPTPLLGEPKIEEYLKDRSSIFNHHRHPIYECILARWWSFVLFHCGLHLRKPRMHHNFFSLLLCLNAIWCFCSLSFLNIFFNIILSPSLSSTSSTDILHHK